MNFLTYLYLSWVNTYCKLRHRNKYWLLAAEPFENKPYAWCEKCQVWRSRL
jgi:hypothetical protein